MKYLSHLDRNEKGELQPRKSRKGDRNRNFVNNRKLHSKSAKADRKRDAEKAAAQKAADLLLRPELAENLGTSSPALP